MKIKLAKSELIHFVGIGGIGMSGLAIIMKELGFKVQGSDISTNKNIDRVKQKFDQKIKKEKLSSIDLEKNPDILAEIDNKKIVKVGFAAESENLIENAKKKLSSKDCNLIVANDITLEGSGFGSDNNKATLVHKEGCDDLPLMKKSELAHKILDRTIEYID